MVLNSWRIASSKMRSITFIPGDPASAFIMCRNSPDSSRRIDCAWEASPLHSSLGVVNGSSALLEWLELVAFA